MVPHNQAASHGRLFPPSAGFCIADGYESRSLLQPIRFRTWFTWANLQRIIEKTKFQKDFFNLWRKDAFFFAYHFHAAHISSLKTNILSDHLQTTQRS